MDRKIYTGNFNMINAMLWRIHLGGRCDLLKPECFELVKEAIGCYKEIRGNIPQGAPIWPIGFPKTSDEWLAFGLECGKKTYLAVWRLGAAEDCCTIPLEKLRDPKIRCIYPQKLAPVFHFSDLNKFLTVKLDQPYCARLFEITE